jgi:RNA polymerase subunit RPABC4/transcription elongation factor Spt4
MVNIETQLPSTFHSFEYVKNSHFIRLTDDDGNSTKLNAKDIIQFTCNKCKNVFWMGTNQASNCPTCLSNELNRDWVNLQLSFIPERESEFKSPIQNKPEK